MDSSESLPSYLPPYELHAIQSDHHDTIPSEPPPQYTFPDIPRPLGSRNLTLSSDPPEVGFNPWESSRPALQIPTPTAQPKFPQRAGNTQNPEPNPAPSNPDVEPVAERVSTRQHSNSIANLNRSPNGVAAYENRCLIFCRLAG